MTKHVDGSIWGATQGVPGAVVRLTKPLAAHFQLRPDPLAK